MRSIRPPKRPQGKRISIVTRVGAAMPPMDCPPEFAVAELILTTNEDQRVYRISSEALERGVLIGQYPRCLDIGGDISRLSRVHLLISRVGHQVLAIDTASTNGSLRHTDTGFESVVLRAHDKMVLADTLLVEWKHKELAQA